MIKKTLFSLLAIVSFACAQTLAHVWPIYQGDDCHFVAIRTEKMGLSALIVDSPNTQAFSEQVQQWHNHAHSTQAAQTHEEFEDVMSLLDRSNLVGYLVIDSTAPVRFLDDQAFLAETQDTKPYFQEGVGVYFQTIENKRAKLTRDLNTLIAVQESVQEKSMAEDL